MRPNEKFSGKGHRTHVCKECQRIPKADRDSIDWREEIYGFLCQSNISKKNMVRLRALIEMADCETGRLAQIVLDVARVKPHRKRRLKFLARERPDLIDELEETGLIMAHYRY